MAPKTAPVDLGLDELDDDGSLEEWGLDGIGEDEDDEDPTGDSPEAGETEDPADGDEPDAQVDDDADLPGDDEVEEPNTPAAATPDPGPSATADRPEENATPDVPEVKPWSFKADGKEVQVPRSQIFRGKNADGTEEDYVLFPAAEINRTLANHLADRGVWREEKKGLLQQLAERDPQHNPDVVKARELTKELFELLEKSDDEILEWRDKLKGGRGEWEAKREADALKKQLEARNGVTIDPDPELQKIQDEELETQLQGSLRKNLGELLKRPEFAGLDLDDLYAELWDLKDRVYFEAAEDIPSARMKKGDIGINLEFVGGHLQRQAARIQRARESALRAKEIERENAERLGTPARKPDASKPKPRPRRKAEEDAFDVDAFLNTDNDI